MKSTAIVTAMIALFVAIGMTGSAMAGSTTQTWIGDGHYNTQFIGTGSGDLSIYTQTSYGNDRLIVNWDGSLKGHQTMNTPPAGFTKINRLATVGTGTYGDAAAGTISTLTESADTGNGHYIATESAYKDDAAYGSHVTLSQNVKMEDNGPDEVLSGKVVISGFAYGADTLVSGLVKAGVFGEQLVAANVIMDEGKFSMSMRTVARDAPSSYKDVTGLKKMVTTATGDGTAVIVGSGDDVRLNLHTTNDGLIDHFNGAQGTYFEQLDDFDTGYSANGRIYVYEI